MAEMLCIFDLGIFKDANTPQLSFYVTENLCTIIQIEGYGIFVVKTDSQYASDKIVQMKAVLTSGLMLPSDHTQLGNCLYTRSTTVQFIDHEVTMFACPIDFYDIEDYYNLKLDSEKDFVFDKVTFPEVRRQEYAASGEQNYNEYDDKREQHQNDIEEEGTQSIDEQNADEDQNQEQTTTEADETTDQQDSCETMAGDDQDEGKGKMSLRFTQKVTDDGRGYTRMSYPMSNVSNDVDEDYGLFLDRRCDKEESYEGLGSFGFDLSTFEINRPTDSPEPIDLSSDHVQCESVTKIQKVRTSVLKGSTFDNPKAKSTLSEPKTKAKGQPKAKKEKKKKNKGKVNYSATGLDSIAHLNKIEDFIGVLRSSKEHTVPGVFKNDSYYRHGRSYAHIVDGVVCLTDEKVKFWACQSKFTDPNDIIKKTTAKQIQDLVEDYMRDH